MRVSVLAFLAGILCLHALAALPPPAWAFALVPLAALAAWKRGALPLFFLAFGFFFAAFRAGLILDDALPRALEGHDLRVEGVIADLPRPGDRGARFLFDVERATRDGVPVTVPRHVALSEYNPTIPLRAGERYAFTVRLKRPHGAQNPGGFDYEAYLFRNRVRAGGYVRARPAGRALGVAPGYTLARARARVGERLRAALPGNPFTGVLVAFANGDDSGIDDAQWETFRRTGTTHLIAISGMNVGLIAAIAFVLGRWLWSVSAWLLLRWPAQKAGAVAAVLAAAGYAALAGFAIPTQRALIMVAVAMGALIAGRRLRASSVLALGLFAVLLFDPFAVLAPGFWLSFLAVAAMLQVAARDGGHLTRFARAQFAVTVALLPVMLLLFQQVPLVSPLANAVAIPVIEIAAIPLTLIAAALSPLSLALAALPLKLAAATLAALWWVLERLALGSASQWVQHRPLLWTLPLAAVGIAWLLAPRGTPARAVGLAWLLPMLLLRPAPPPAGAVRLTLLDVGQGLAAVVQTRTHVLLFDAGPRFSRRADAGRSVIVPFLRTRGIDKIDLAVVSHAHADHVGGLDSVRRAFAVTELVSGEPERVAGARRCVAGMHWDWDDVRVRVVSPRADAGWRDNDAGCVLRVESRYGSVLLPGDVGARVERALAGHGDLASASVLVAPHHGSKTSSSAEFIAAVRPRFVLFPVGYLNRYRHPDAGVLSRYAQAGAHVHDSARAGAVSVTLGPEGPAVDDYRDSRRRFWFSD